MFTQGERQVKKPLSPLASVHQTVFGEPTHEGAEVPPQETQQPAAVDAVNQPGHGSAPAQETADPMTEHAGTLIVE
jgi:hypothetical protein